MSSFALNTSTGDLLYENNRLSLTEGQEGIRQHMQSRFGFFYGEWPFDITLGVPYYQKILVKGPMYAVVSEILKSTALNTPGITELLSWSLSFDSAFRITTLEFAALSTDGVIDFTQEVDLF